MALLTISEVGGWLGFPLGFFPFFCCEAEPLLLAAAAVAPPEPALAPPAFAEACWVEVASAIVAAGGRDETRDVREVGGYLRDRAAGSCTAASSRTSTVYGV